MRPNIRTAITAAAIAAVLAAGCSSADTKNEYVDAVNEIQANAVETLNQTVSGTTSDAKGQVQQLEAGHEAFSSAVAELEGLDVPEEVEDTHPELVAGFEDLARLYKESAADARGAKGLGEVLGATSEIGAEGRAIAADLDETIDQINEDLGAD